MAQAASSPSDVLDTNLDTPAVMRLLHDDVVPLLSAALLAIGMRDYGPGEDYLTRACEALRELMATSSSTAAPATGQSRPWTSSKFTP